MRSSVSVGLVAYPDDGSTIEQLVAAADVAMYEAKRRGKNRIVGYQMRTERVATDIDAESSDLVQLTPAESVRTGGDPVPWSSRPATRPTYGEPTERRLDPPPEPSSRRRSDRSTIPVEPDEDAVPPWSSGVPQQAQPNRPSLEPEPPRPEALPPEETPEPPTRTRTAVEAPDQPWLTRTDDMPEVATNGSGTVRPGDDAVDRPATGYGPPGSGSSRTDEIRGDTVDRPWIALPIEPDDDGDRRSG